VCQWTNCGIFQWLLSYFGRRFSLLSHVYIEFRLYPPDSSGQFSFSTIQLTSSRVYDHIYTFWSSPVDTTATAIAPALEQEHLPITISDIMKILKSRSLSWTAKLTPTQCSREEKHPRLLGGIALLFVKRPRSGVTGGIDSVVYQTPVHFLQRPRTGLVEQPTRTMSSGCSGELASLRCEDHGHGGIRVVVRHGAWQLRC
jgi:hypothetical protein